MVGGLLIQEKGKSPYMSTGLVNAQGTDEETQKPDVLVIYDGADTAVPTLVCPGHLRLNPAYGLGYLTGFEIPYSDIVQINTVVGSYALTKKKVKARCNMAACSDNFTFGVYIKPMQDPRIPVLYEQRYFDWQADIDPDCVTDCTTRAQFLADKINADPMATVVATVEVTNTGGGAGTGTGTGTGTGGANVTNYWLVLEAKNANEDFRAEFEGFLEYTVLVNYSVPSYTVGKMREAYGPGFMSALADTVVLTATEITYRKLVVVGNSGGTSSTATYNENYEVQHRLCVVITNAAVSNSAAAKTELDVITNGTKTPVALYLDKQC